MFTDHDRIENERKRKRLCSLGECFDVCHTAQCSNLSGLRWDIAQNSVELRKNEVAVQDLNGGNRLCILYSQQRNNACAIHAVLMERFQIGLNPRSAGRIGTGDRHRDRYHGEFSNGAEKKSNSHCIA